MLKKIVLAAVGLFAVFVLFRYLDGGKPADILPKKSFEIVAHRGIHQVTPGQQGEYCQKDKHHQIYGCEATLISKPTHEYIENTIESIEAAFSFGATIVEFDVHITGDNQLVVFHDWMLECKTDGKGKVSNHPLSYLKTLDIGYGYTYNNSKTYPLRGKGIGKMPTLMEVLKQFPDKKFLINQKDGSMKTTDILVNVIKTLPIEQQGNLYYGGNDNSYEYIQKEIPTITRLFGTRPQV